jgi:hypothetical protein
MIALPDYHDDGVAHWGIPIFKETKLLFKNTTVTELVKQRIALLISKTFAEFVSLYIYYFIKEKY